MTSVALYVDLLGVLMGLFAGRYGYVAVVFSARLTFFITLNNARDVSQDI